MAAAIWILLILYPFLAQCESGDDEAELKILCHSLLNFKNYTLICNVDEADEVVEFATLCLVSTPDECVNATLDQDKFTFQVEQIISHYKLQVYTEGGDIQEQNIALKDIVKLDAPWIANATYINDEAVIYIKHKHGYVDMPEFQIQIWGDDRKYSEEVNVTYPKVIIGGDRLKHGGRYNVRVRARPVGYFGGQWSDWSAVKSFNVNNKVVVVAEPKLKILCHSLLAIINYTLICNVDEADEVVEFATLCLVPTPDKCVNATLDQDKFMFQVEQIISHYKLQVYTEGGDIQEQNIVLKDIVKLNAPRIANATYINDEAVIYIKHKHGYVDMPEFQVQIWGDDRKYSEEVNVTYPKVVIGGDRLKHGGRYNVRVRARPVGYFGGQWSDWSAVKSFNVNNKVVVVADAEAPSLLYILLITSPILLILIGFSISRWWKEIQAYLFPAIPHPKATLAQIQREKHSPVSFSPEIFKDINIYPVDYIEEKSNEDQGDLSRPLSLYEKEDGDEQRLEAEISHLKIKLLDECTSAEERENNAGCQSLAAVQRHGKDETYVTMSSLYKTQ